MALCMKLCNTPYMVCLFNSQNTLGHTENLNLEIEKFC